MAEGMSERGLDCSEGPQGGEVGLKDGSGSIDSVPFKEDVETTRASGCVQSKWTVLGRRP